MQEMKKYRQKSIADYVPATDFESSLSEEGKSNQGETMEIESIKNEKMQINKSEKTKKGKNHKKSISRPLKKAKLNEGITELTEKEDFYNDTMINASDSLSQVSSTISPENETAKKALRWKYFELVGDRLRCIQCYTRDPKNPITYAVGCSNTALKGHLSAVHEGQNTKITQFFKDNSIQVPYTDSQKKNFLYQLVVIEDLPFSIVDSNIFKTFCNALDPDFKIICRQTLSKKVEEEYQIKKKYLKTFLKNIDSKISITIDGWTSPNYEPYLGITGFQIIINIILIKIKYTI